MRQSASPFVRRGLVVLALLVIVLLFAALLWSWSGQRRFSRSVEVFERTVGELDLATFELPPVPRAQNAAHWALAASHATVFPDDTVDAVRELVRQPITTWEGADFALARRVVDENRAALELFSKALEVSDSSFGIDYSQGFDADIPDRMIDLVRGSRLLRLETRLALLEGQPERALAAIQAHHRMIEALSRESTLLTAIVDLALLAATTHMAEDLLALAISDEELLEAAIEMSSHPDPRPVLGRAFRAEATLAAITPIERYAELEIAQGSWWREWLWKQSHNRMRAAILDDYRTLVGALQMPWSHFHRQSFEPGFWSGRSPLWPNVIDNLERLEATETARSLGREALELWRRRLAGEPYPETLPEAALPADTFSGEPVAYERFDDGTARLAAPGAIELWREVHPEPTEREMPVFVWEIPAPTGVPVGR